MSVEFHLTLSSPRFVRWRVGSTVALAVACAILFSVSLRVQTAQAEETLETVLAEIYNADLSLAAARWRLQATNQGVSVAEQRGRASASIRSSVTRSYSKWSQKQQAREGGEIPSSKGTDITLPREGSIGFTQPIVIGKTLEYLVDAAEAQVYAARERYSASEQQVLLGGVSAYMALWRDQALLEIESEAEEISKGELEIVKRRALLGEATRTDVILGEARLASASAERLAAIAARENSELVLARLLERTPDKVSTPQFLPAPAEGQSELIEIARTTHPSIEALRFDLDASYQNLLAARRALTPLVNLKGSYGHSVRDVDDGYDQRAQNVTLALELEIPFLVQGQFTDTYRRLLATHRGLEQDHRRVRRQVEEAVSRAWNNRETASVRIEALKVSVRSSEEALTAVREENRVGLRSQSELYSAESDLLNARRSLVRARHDWVVSSFNLLAEAGRLNPETLTLGVQSYDPEPAYQESRAQKWQDYGILTEPQLDAVLNGAND